ncbi:AraC family transcriptional regulator [Cohnella endophytica]|uniref:AraC family transcriptional regulator n=2 Tax=Cohnella endophytica TaxID=2419778 RepID=A0A494XVQ6_9BACL|nr:AraC family transcriptional regulator [Cohnella endophytica]
MSVLFSGEAQPIALHKMGPAIHDYYLIHTVLSGSGKFSIRDRSYSCRAGDSFLIFPGELFFYQADELQPWSYVWVAFAGRGSGELMETIGASPDEAVIRGTAIPRIRSYYNQLRECFPSGTHPELSNLEANGWLRLLLQQLGLAKRQPAAIDPPTDSAGDYAIKQAIQYLSLQYAQTISIAQMSSMLGYHRTHLCKLFKQSTGISPMQYLMKIRMTRAEQLLLTTSMTIEQISSSVGFGDALYFSRKFRKWRGQAPSEYRHTARNPR